LLDLGGNKMRKMGAVLLIGGACIAAVYLLYWFFSAVADSIPVALKVAIAAAAIGVVLLFLSIIRERQRSTKEERQLKEVER
jgi:membrane protein implicated in regulation of membrane protease activity